MKEQTIEKKLLMCCICKKGTLNEKDWKHYTKEELIALECNGGYLITTGYCKRCAEKEYQKYGHLRI
jgi:hypothetical protein